jgi:hypothetical protein
MDGRSYPLCIVQTRHIVRILSIFFKNTSNIFKYARIYSNISLLGRHEGLLGITGG